jgi:type IV pilus assembly protein PilC
LATSNPATINSIARASRYLSGIGTTVGFKDALHRIKEKSSVAVVEKLQTLERFVNGESAHSPSPELALIADVVRNAPEHVNTGSAIGAVNSALADAKILADHLRSGMPGDLGYSALLLMVAGIISITWITSIAPKFVNMFAEMNAPLPTLSQLMVDFPWVVFVLIALLAVVVISVVFGTKFVAVRVESIAPLEGTLTAHILGRAVRQAHQRWRTLTIANAWSAGGQEPLQAVRHAAQVSKASDSVSNELTSAVSLANDIGAGQAELDYLALESVAVYRKALEWWRAIVFRFLQVAIAVLVGIIVVAVYLPIFKMGAIV